MDYLRIRRLGVRVPPSALHILAGHGFKKFILKNKVGYLVFDQPLNRCLG